ncbi:hypothetical protein D5086_032548 [Populus alba]|uniref:Uncharacterized protein n=1 Tax=Populus alba TaxID=43335 RepID=A0ACC4ALL9_POPAL
MIPMECMRIVLFLNIQDLLEQATEEQRFLNPQSLSVSSVDQQGVAASQNLKDQSSEKHSSTPPTSVVPDCKEFEVENRTYPSLASFPYGRSMDLGSLNFDSNCIVYKVPEWVGAQPFDSDVQAIYASEGALPMILPLKPEKG